MVVEALPTSYACLSARAREPRPTHRRCGSVSTRNHTRPSDKISTATKQPISTSRGLRAQYSPYKTKEVS